MYEVYTYVRLCKIFHNHCMMNYIYVCVIILPYDSRSHLHSGDIHIKTAALARGTPKMLHLGPSHSYSSHGALGKAAVGAFAKLALGLQEMGKICSSTQQKWRVKTCLAACTADSFCQT